MPELSFHRVTGVAIQATPRNNGGGDHYSRTISLLVKRLRSFCIAMTQTHY